MVTKPDIIINKSAKFGQAVLFVIAGFCALLTIGSIGNGNVAGVLVFGIVTLCIIIWASSIKTTYRRRGGVDIYK